MSRKMLRFLGLLAVGAIVVACSDRKSADDDGPLDGPFTLPYSGEELARRVQEAIDATGAYTVSVQQSNLVLPQWGGSDGGSVTVGLRDGRTSATASLHRTGDGDYTIWLSGGQTYFRRSTCDAMARVPGGGERVLEPFILVGNDRVRDATNLRAASGRTVLILTIEGIGDTEISFDPRTFLPSQLSSRTATNNGKPLVWTFEKWGEQPKLGVASEFDKAYDRGPGGNPC